MIVNFASVDDTKNLEPLPPGTYRCQVESVEEAKTSRGDPRWKLTLVVSEGAHSGRRIYDSLVFSAAALPRVKYVCATLGLDVSQELDLTPAMLKGRWCLVEVELTTYETNEGKVRQTNAVPYRGYEKAEGAPF